MHKVVYSFNASSYILDSETYGGAPFKAAERTDYDNLDYVLPVDGKYHLRMTNELPETQYTDEIKLIVVDHPRGTNVIPESHGSIHTISSPVAPLSATDFDGQDVAKLIAKKDELFWESNPFSKNPEIPDELRDGLILEFPRPLGGPRPLNEEAKNSFPSRHTSLAFAMATVVGNRYPKLRITLYAIALGTAFSRIYLGHHYPSDVIAGAVIGTLAGMHVIHHREMILGLSF